MTDEQSWSEYTLRLNDTTKQLFLAVIRKMNPDYKPTEKMNDVTLHVSMADIKPDLKNLEKHLKVPSFYYTGMYASETYNKEYDLIDSQSPYWFYLECGKRIFLKQEYLQKKRDFALMFSQGISKGYAYVSLDYLGILMGIFSLLYSFQSYSEDKRVGINRFFMIVLSVLFVCLAIVLFEYRKEHEKLFGLERIRNRLITPMRETFCQRDKRQSTRIKPLSSYIIGQSVHKSVLLYLPYLCVILPIVISKNMDTLAVATIGENIILFASLFLFVRLGNMEKNNGMESQVFTAKMRYPLLYLWRIILLRDILFISCTIFWTRYYQKECS
jgi:hypothetical protein